MIAGRLRYRLRVLEPVSVGDGFGSVTGGFVDRGVIRAERVRSSGYRSVEAGELFADHRAEFVVRDAHGVGENWRVEEVGGYLYVVVAVIVNRDRGMKTLVCERVNL